MEFPVIWTVWLTGVSLTGTGYTEFDIQTRRSPVNGSPVNKFRREVPVNRTVPLMGTEFISIIEYIFRLKNEH